MIALDRGFEGMVDRDARLLDARCRQSRRADHVTGGVDVGRDGLIMRVHRHEAAMARRDARRGEIDVGGVALSSGADEQAVA